MNVSHSILPNTIYQASQSKPSQVSFGSRFEPFENRGKGINSLRTKYVYLLMLLTTAVVAIPLHLLNSSKPEVESTSQASFVASSANVSTIDVSTIKP